jgi:predicted membrane metal-binding protein
MDRHRAAGRGAGHRHSAAAAGAVAWSLYALLASGALVVAALVLRRWAPRWRAHAALLIACAVLAFAATGARALLFAGGTLAPALEGKDLTVTGVVAAMPQRNEAGTRLRLDVESARSANGECTLPPRLLWAGTARRARWARRSSCSGSRPTCGPASAGR